MPIINAIIKEIEGIKFKIMINDNEYLIELLRKAHQGDNQAIEIVVDMLYPRLYKIAYQYLRDKMLSEDVAFESIYKLMSSNLKNIRNINGWVSVIAKNRCLDIIKRRNREICKDDMSICAADNTHIDYIEKLHIEQCLASLSSKERQMLLLNYYGYTMKESVKLVGVTTAQGRRLLRKAQENFKKNYEK